MDRIRVLVCSPHETVSDYVRANVRSENFEVQWVPPGYRAIRAASSWFPDVALVDCGSEGTDQACIQIEGLKQVCPDIRVIVHTDESKPEDAGLVERGIFFYAAFALGPELIQVIEAAACRQRGGDALSVDRRDSPGSSPGKKKKRRESR